MVELNATDAHATRVCKSILIILHQDKYLRANDTQAKSISHPQAKIESHWFIYSILGRGAHFGPTRGNGFIRETNWRRESAKADCARGAGLFNLIALKYLICKVARLNLMPPVRSPGQKTVGAFVCCWAREQLTQLESLCPCQVDRSDDKIK
jgi:hypothetical protein